jgi:phosphatidate cytidylyltransferase
MNLGRLRHLTVNEQVALLFLALFGVLVLVTVAVALRSLASDDERRWREQQFRRDLRAVWVGALVFWVAWVSGPVGATLAFGAFSFLALREFITLAHTRRGDHRGLILAFFVVLPLQYLIVGLQRFDLFSVFIPVYVFLAIPVVSALAGDPRRFLERNAKIQWGIMVCVFGLSHAPALILLDLPRFQGRGAFLLFFLVIVTAAAQIVQELAGRRLRRTAAGAPHRPPLLAAGLGAGRAGRRGHGGRAVLDHAHQRRARRCWARWPAAAARWANW